MQYIIGPSGQLTIGTSTLFHRARVIFRVPKYIFDQEAVCHIPWVTLRSCRG